MTKQVRLEGLGLSENPVVPHPRSGESWPTVAFELDSTLSVPLPRTGGITISVPPASEINIPIPDFTF